MNNYVASVNGVIYRGVVTKQPLKSMALLSVVVSEERSTYSVWREYADDDLMGSIYSLAEIFPTSERGQAIEYAVGLAVAARKKVQP